ncbi:Gmad2 immunoglobulin-like domain-containing protein [Paenibacillus sp. NRS-1760]|uniref:Gmad2 immunoglobulin-like domain-containing protein n=1 Tax=Paenibacillus sp. NRS-1760 TaxID=3233902 RepID=UPI003D26A755
MKKIVVGTVVASVIAGATLIGLMTNSVSDRSIVQAKENVNQITQQHVKQPTANISNDSFRNIEAAKQSLVFEINGEASLFEGTYHFTIKQGDKIIMTDFGTASVGGPEWGKVNQTIIVPVNKLSLDNPLHIELYEIDQESGEQVRKINMPLTMYASSKKVDNESFRNLMITPVSVDYSLKGETFRGTYNYTLKHGEKVLASGFGTASIGAPDWGKVPYDWNRLGEHNQSTTITHKEADRHFN